MLRTLGAFVVAPFPAALIQSVVVGLAPKTGTGIFEHPASMFVGICLYFYIFGLLFGLPAWLVLRRRSAALRVYVLLGLIAAVTPIAAALLVMALRGQGSASIAIYDLMLFGLGGMIAGAVFWRIALHEKQSTDLRGTFS